MRSTENAALIQPDRLDVLIHLLALEQLAGARRDSSEFSIRGVDWVARSEAFSAEDNEIGVAALAAELLTSPDYSLEVSFASGGQLVRGAAVAAAALYSGRDVSRVDATDKVIDRSHEALRSSGWSVAELAEVLAAWVRVDPQSVVVLIDLDSPGAVEAEHELRCRYPILAASLDHVSADDLSGVITAAQGSVQVVYLRADRSVFAPVLQSHQDAIALVRRGHDVAAVLHALNAPDRASSTSPGHDRRLRRLRWLQRKNVLMERALRR